MNLSTFELFRSIDAEAAGLITLSQEQLDDLHKVLLSIADDIMDVCEANGLTCLICGGTALGAYREGKFIPWDDDLDFIMPRADYSKFIALFKDKYGDKYWVHTPEETDNFGFPNPHIRKKGTKVKTKSDLFDDSEAGANVDIFIAENAFNNKFLRVLHGFLCLFCGLMLSCRRFFRDRKPLMNIVGYSPKKSQVFRTKILLGCITAIFPINFWTRVTNRVFSLCKNDHSEYVVIPSGRKHYSEMYLRDKLCGRHPISFEDRTWFVPYDIEYHLRLLYGENFKEVPPPEKREKHICWEFDLGNK